MLLLSDVEKLPKSAGDPEVEARCVTGDMLTGGTEDFVLSGGTAAE